MTTTPPTPTNPTPSRVRLATSDWIAIVGIFWTPFTAIVALFVSMWTRLAVVETKVDAHERWLDTHQTHIETMEDARPRARHPLAGHHAQP